MTREWDGRLRHGNLHRKINGVESPIRSFSESLVLRIGVFALGFVPISIAVSHCPGTQEPGIEYHLNSDSQLGYQSLLSPLVYLFLVTD